jgi:hypothetical protein
MTILVLYAIVALFIVKVTREPKPYCRSHTAQWWEQRSKLWPNP